MRMTVGPLPPAVYWRRRAVVLGAGLLFLIVIFTSCSGPDGEDGRRKGGSAQPTGSAGPTTSVDPTASPDPSAGAGGESVGPGEGTTPQRPPGGPTGPADVPPATSPDPGTCTDDEISVVPVPSRATVRQGEAVQLKIKIKNVSKRTCRRDVGADAQELFIKQGARKVWSSDACSTVRNTDVQSFPPNLEHEYQVAWSGKDSSTCADGVATGPFPEPGDYQLFGRLGTKFSAPVQLTITD